MKRRMFSRLYSHFLSQPGETSPDERHDIVHHVEQLSQSDLTLLDLFSRRRAMRGDELTNTVDPGWGKVGKEESDIDWLQRHGALVHSIAKLESRGLLLQTHLNAALSYAGDPGTSFNRFRGRAWQITPIGMKLAKSLGQMPGK